MKTILPTTQATKFRNALAPFGGTNWTALTIGIVACEIAALWI